MSLGRLLRRASSRASDLLTLTPSAAGSSSVLDGEIIYSKNNVCVHPPELLQGMGEHHPGYLCLYMEKDELLGSTLILAWVPNSRIQRQDEEALRYITPESSPVRKAPRKRGRHAQGLATGQPPTPPEQRGALTLRGDEILTVTQLGAPSSEGEKLAQSGARPSPQPPRSDSGTLSTVSSQEEHNSEALGKSSSSVFLDSESRDTCDNRMTCSTSSASSLDTSAQFQENNGQTPSTRWDEQQKVFTLEQVCGVFRVDLGQMRSLRLFFSDEACTCGQLVVASRESQYKIFHFHHGGLDKLSEVFQQWKYCTETHLKDQQLSDEKTCMQFSIRRPKLPSSETHPEENSSRRLDVSAWLQHLNDAGQVEEEYKLRKAIFFGGIDISIRGEVWPFLLHYYSYESTSEEREALRLQKRKEYFEIQEKRLSMAPDEQKDFWRQVQFTVDKDVVRTDRSNQFFRGEGNPNVETMRRILLNYAVFNPAIGYSQGMSDLVAPLLAEVLDESDTFWCFVGLMQNTIFISSPRDEDMEKQLLYLRELLRLMHPRFHQHLCALGEDGLQMLFCHRWILLCFKREFPEAEALRMWEACWAHYQTDYFHLFICVAIVVIYGDDVIEQQLATDQMLLHFSNLAMHMNGELVLRKARSLLYQFHLLPRIPCSLHDLCKLCGTGMWDSGFIPAVECSGHHPESESCPYGGLVEESSPKAGSEGKKGLRTRDVFAFRK
ncbi:TBC1 domain family member 16 isoform X3 [Catharus ustulatus]|uniref:TBC1 domain family member 16 isoform X3 n=1 Tax=Catharus ustulatus TaxID=91951 RepID=UPI0014085C08|nr:TBC1 domain family member 16 isoform X3 [Catharus ustulatus]